MTAPDWRDGHPDHTGWSDSAARSVLQLMVESVAEMVGFDVAALSVVLGDELVTMAYTGPEEFRHDVYEHADPVSVLDLIVERGERWGRFHFLAAEKYDAGELDGHWFVVSEQQVDDPDAWHPLDVLMALLTDDDGRLVGALSLDKPLSGLRPDPSLHSILEKYAAQSERAVLTAFEREAMVQQIAHAEAARRMVRAASRPAHSSLDSVLHSTHRPLVDGFGAAGSWIEVLDPVGAGVGHARTRDGEPVTISPAMRRLARDLAPRLWDEQRVMVFDARDDDVPTRTTALTAEARRQLHSFDLVSAMAVPLGTGTECLGFLVLTRGTDDPSWSPVETESALEIGHDLGAALMTARALESERDLVRELQALDDYRSQLIATLSHELRTPLTVISGNLELLGELDLEDVAAHLQRAMARGATRMQKVVDDLLLLAQVSDPRHPLARASVDLRSLARDVVGLVESTARAKGLDLRLDLEPTGPPLGLVHGDPSELDRMLGNLVSNAVKYTPAGGTVTVTARREGRDVLIEVADNGLGISQEDQVGLFRAFFRTTNPDALREPGTGLGLTIVATIVERHAGTVRVASRLGEGTTFRVRLPMRDLART